MTATRARNDLDANEGIRLFPSVMNAAVASSFKTLMESKGLYQSAPIDRASTLQSVRERVGQAFLSDFDRLISNDYPANGGLLLAESSLLAAGSQQELLVLRPVNVKLFCAKCDRDEAFKPIWSQEITNEMTKPSAGQNRAARAFPRDFQYFSLVYQCQSCLGLPEAFLIRREGFKLAIHGRSPIQNVAVPSSLPSAEARWYREAVIARNSGRTLAAIFYLRTFVEQFARRVTRLKGRLPGDEILAAYNATVPDPPRSAMPSLREWYGKLSELIHSANEDAELLKNAFEEIERHFEFRKLYKMSESPGEKGDEGTKPRFAGTLGGSTGSESS